MELFGKAEMIFSGADLRVVVLVVQQTKEHKNMVGFILFLCCSGVKQMADGLRRKTRQRAMMWRPFVKQKLSLVTRVDGYRADYGHSL